MEDSKPRFIRYCTECGGRLTFRRKARPHYDAYTGEVTEVEYFLECPSGFEWMGHTESIIKAPPDAGVPGYAEWLIVEDLKENGRQRIAGRQHKRVLTVLLAVAGFIVAVALGAYLLTLIGRIPS